MADISGITGAWTRYEDTIVRESKGDNLGKEDFLKLLVAQLTHQDPTSPMDDTQFISQLAQYSGLEQQMNMNKNLETLIASNNANTAASAVELIGTVVGYSDAEGQLKTGLVTFLDIVGGEVNLYLHDGTYLPFSDVQQIGMMADDLPAGSGSSSSSSDTTNEDAGSEGTSGLDDDDDGGTV
ncbi:MAG: flagellar hook assembly protein FlgD [Synergistaceae bacterium]|jgi:flagellar basal-body rod modification protein FlgD|nr:flagellar hook assembly protein FlgD [Synergistaceae bacterium]